MKKALVTTILTLTTCLFLRAQTSVAFQHLGNATFQHNLINPSLIPEGKLFIGLPVLSGVHANVNNKVSYSEAFSNGENGGTLIDVDKILGELQNQNMLSAKVNVNLLHIGYRLESGPLLSLNINERIEGDFLYPKQIVDYVWNGNDSYLNEDVKVSRTGLLASHFREFGIGLAAPVNDQLTVGIRGKFLVGFANVSVPGNAKATLRSNGEAFQLDANWENAEFRTSGLDIYEGNGEFDGQLGSHLVMNSNTGFALDLGGTYHLNRYYTLTGSIVDIGFINWKENIKNEALVDSSFNYSGIDIATLDNIGETLQDSLFDGFSTRDNNNPYRSWLPTTAYGSWIYHYNQNTDFYVTVGSRWVQRQFKMMYGVGINQKVGRAFTASLSATKLPQQFLNLGGAIAAKGGPVQFYLAVDHLINFDIPKSKAVDVRVGMNFVFGKRRGREESGLSTAPIQGAKGLDTDVFLGKSVKTKKRDGIYSIIKKQKKRELKSKKTKRDGSVKKKSLNGRTGKKNANGKE